MLAKELFLASTSRTGRPSREPTFVNLRQAGDPVELGRAYGEQGLMNWSFWISLPATRVARLYGLGERVAANISIPFTVGGGINELSDVDRLLSTRADKVSINSSAIRNPNLIDEIAKHFGSQVCVVAIDAKTDRPRVEMLSERGTSRDRQISVRVGLGSKQPGSRRNSFYQHEPRRRVKTGYANKALATPSPTHSLFLLLHREVGKMEHLRILYREGKADGTSVFTSEKSKYPN